MIVTGRKGRFVAADDGGWVYQRRNEGAGVTLLDINLKEKVRAELPLAQWEGSTEVGNHRTLITSL